VVQFLRHFRPDSLPVDTVFRKLSGVKCFAYNGKVRRGVSPTEMYHQYLHLIPLLPSADSEVAKWLINLPSQFFYSLDNDIVREVLSPDSFFSYSLPSQTKLGSLSAQTFHLHCVCAHVQRIWDHSRHNEQLVRTQVLRMTGGYINGPQASHQRATASTNHPPAPVLLANSGVANKVCCNDVSVFLYPAETTLNQYAGSSARGDDYPTDPINGFRSRFPRGFLGCMFCGSTAHKFRECTRRDEQLLRSVRIFLRASPTDAVSPSRLAVSRHQHESALTVLPLCCRLIHLHSILCWLPLPMVC
jgi:hypothetical protein